MDTMQESLNKEIQESCFPHWRNHPSLKGWCAMNYPSTVTNPLLRRHQEAAQAQNEPIKKMNAITDYKVFSNTERPYSCPQGPTSRPFSSQHQTSGLGKPTTTKILSRAGLQTVSQPGLAPIPENIDPAKASEPAADSKQSAAQQPAEVPPAETEQKIDTVDSITNKFFAKSFHNTDYSCLTNSNIQSVAKTVDGMPMPKKFALAKKKKALEEKKALIAKYKDEGKEVPPHLKPKKVDKKRFPVIEPPPHPKDLSVTDALSDTIGWSNSNNVSKKFASGTLTTAKFGQKTDNFVEMNKLAEEKGSIYPQSAYFGKTPVEGADPYITRTVKQLNDIDFSEDEQDWEEEEIKNLKRMPKTILNEENFKQCVTPEITRITLENHYWLSNSLLEKLGRMAPNLQQINLRRMKFMTNPVFAEIFTYLKQLTHVDLTDCDGLLTTATNLMVTKNPNLEFIQLSGCTKGVDDRVMSNIAGL